jgi:hypothetical protein
MERPKLNDIKIYPSDEVLSANLATAKSTWDKFQILLKADPQITPEWRYYQDGKTWLFKVIKKKQTLCWVSIWDKFFKVTFYFNSKAEEALRNSNLDENDKAQYFDNHRPLKNKSITVNAQTAYDMDRIAKLLTIKNAVI